MFSEKKFYETIYENLLQPLNIQLTYSNNGVYDTIHDYHNVLTDHAIDLPCFQSVVCYDQEPIYLETVLQFWDPLRFVKYNRPSRDTGFVLRHDALTDGYYIRGEKYFSQNFHLLTTSEHSEEKNRVFKYLDNTYDWYYFYHGFASLDWFKNILYRKPINKYTKLFISFNHLFTEKRNYRLNFIAQVREQGLEPHCLLSLSQDNTQQRIRQDLIDPHCMLSTQAKKLVFKHLIMSPTDNLIIDHYDINGALSADDSLNTFCQGLFHIVNETIFYDAKLHLTEKIFKPIVARRPFMLLCAPGNLEYLRSYGFQTFDRWIDESYDTEPDPDRRIQLVVEQMRRLAGMPQWQIDAMYQEMQPVLEHNFFWFYSGFKRQISTELVYNFKRCLIKHNQGKSSSAVDYLDYSVLDFSDILNRLST